MKNGFRLKPAEGTSVNTSYRQQLASPDSRRPALRFCAKLLRKAFHGEHALHPIESSHGAVGNPQGRSGEGSLLPPLSGRRPPSLNFQFDSGDQA